MGATVRVLVAADRRNYQRNGLIEALRRRRAHTCLISPEDLTHETIADFNIVLLDSGLPYDSAITICRNLRMNSDIPIIMMSSRSDRNSRINGLNSGVDDYMVPPCHIDEIMARIAAVTRPRGRGQAPVEPEPARVGDMTVDINHMTVTIGNRAVDLTKKEFQLLLLIANEKGAVCSREKIASELWGLPEANVHDSIHVLVWRLRAKLGHERIKTVRNVGYQLVTPPITTPRPSLPDKGMRDRPRLRVLSN